MFLLFLSLEKCNIQDIILTIDIFIIGALHVGINFF